MENIEDIEDRLFDEAEVQLDEFHAHEALDRMFLIVDMFNSYVHEHPFVEQNEELRKKAEQVSYLMYDFYNEIANSIEVNEG